MAMIEPRGRIVPVLLSGGAGSRLWPLSRETYPKQLLSLLGENTLLQQTALRVDDRSLFTEPMVIANAEHRFAIGEQLRAVGVDRPTIVLEPFGRNTAPAVAVAALLASESRPRRRDTGDAGRSLGARSRRVSRRDIDGRHGRAIRSIRPVRRSAFVGGDRLRLYPDGRRTGRRFAHSQRCQLRREAGSRDGRAPVGLRRACLEQRDISAAGAPVHRRIGATGAGGSRRLPQGIGRRDPRSRFSSARGARFRGLPDHLDGLRDHGKDRQCRGRSRHVRLERCRKLVGLVVDGGKGSVGQCGDWRCGDGRHLGLLCPRRRATGRGARGRGSRHRHFA